MPFGRRRETLYTKSAKYYSRAKMIIRHSRWSVFLSMVFVFLGRTQSFTFDTRKPSSVTTRSRPRRQQQQQLLQSCRYDMHQRVKQPTILSLSFDDVQWTFHLPENASWWERIQYQTMLLLRSTNSIVSPPFRNGQIILQGYLPTAASEPVIVWDLRRK